MQDALRRSWRTASTERFGSFAELNVWPAAQSVAARDARQPEHPAMRLRRNLGA